MNAGRTVKVALIDVESGCEVAASPIERMTAMLAAFRKIYDGLPAEAKAAINDAAAQTFAPFLGKLSVAASAPSANAAPAPNFAIRITFPAGDGQIEAAERFVNRKDYAARLRQLGMTVEMDGEDVLAGHAEMPTN